MPNYGVVDLGSNSIRLCIYDVKDDEKEYYTKKDFRSLLNNKVIAGLSSHVEDGVFTDSGIMRAIDVLKGHNKRLRYFECKETQVFATAVLRNCSNSTQAINAIEGATGFSISLLSESDEAHLGFVGASSDREIPEGTLIDIGGGSTELTCIRGEDDFDNASMALGSLSSYTACVRCILPTEKEAAAISDQTRKRLARLSAHKHYKNKVFFGIGGSLRAAAKAYAEAFPSGNQPEVLTAKHFDDLIAFCIDDPCSFAHLALKAVPDRIHTVIPGCLIARTVMAECRAVSLSLCKNGVREGYLIERMLKGKVPKYRQTSGKPCPSAKEKGDAEDGR